MRHLWFERRLVCTRSILRLTVTVLLGYCSAGCSYFETARIEREGAQHDPWFPDMTRDVGFARLDDAGFRRVFPDLKKLRVSSLALENTEISDASMPLMSQLSTLEAVGLDRTRVTPDGLRELSALPKLKHVGVTGLAFREQENELRRDLPGVGIDIGGGSVDKIMKATLLENSASTVEWGLNALQVILDGDLWNLLQEDLHGKPRSEALLRESDAAMVGIVKVYKRLLNSVEPASGSEHFDIPAETADKVIKWYIESCASRAFHREDGIWSEKYRRLYAQLEPAATSRYYEFWKQAITITGDKTPSR